MGQLSSLNKFRAYNYNVHDYVHKYVSIIKFQLSIKILVKKTIQFHLFPLPL